MGNMQCTRNQEQTITQTISDEEQRRLNHEKISRLLNHPNICNVIHENNLFNEIIGKPRYTEDMARDIIKQLLQGVEYLHKMKYIHRDIKPENIFYDKKTGLIRLANFEYAIYYNNVPIKDACGTLSYTAPEILDSKKYTNKVDVWSVGIIFYLLLFGKLPFDGDCHYDIILNTINSSLTLNQKILDELSEDCIDLLISMLTKDPNMRISAEVALEHRFFTA